MYSTNIGSTVPSMWWIARRYNWFYSNWRGYIRNLGDLWMPNAKGAVSSYNNYCVSAEIYENIAIKWLNLSWIIELLFFQTMQKCYCNENGEIGKRCDGILCPRCPPRDCDDFKCLPCNGKVCVKSFIINENDLLRLIILYWTLFALQN